MKYLSRTELGFSWGLTSFILAIYLGALACVGYADLSFWIKGSVWIGILFMLTYTLLKIAGHSAQAVIALSADDEGVWWLENREGEGAHGVLRGDSWITSYLLILRFQIGKKIKTVLIAKDAVSAERYHALRFYLYGR